MSRYVPVTDPDAKVNVTTTVTQKMREDLRTLAFAKEHSSVKELLFALVQSYVSENEGFLNTISGLRNEPDIFVPSPEVEPEPEATPVN